MVLVDSRFCLGIYESKLGFSIFPYFVFFPVKSEFFLSQPHTGSHIKSHTKSHTKYHTKSRSNPTLYPNPTFLYPHPTFYTQTLVVGIEVPTKSQV